MPGNFNKGNNFQIPAQVAFGSFLVKALDAKNIPWSVNAQKKYYDFELNEWFYITNETGLPVIHALQNPYEAVLYADSNYQGPFIRLGVGEHDEADLIAKGFQQVFSIMVPIDMEVILYSEAGFQGTAQTPLRQTTQYLHPNVVKSVKINRL